MKKLLLLSLLLAPSLLWAQGVDEVSNEYKPVSGEKTLELQLRPFGDPVISISGLRIRSFVTAQKAYRMNVFLSVNSFTNIIQQENPDFNLKELKSTTSSFTINLSPGMEYHLDGTDRISPYYGWEGSVGFRRSSLNSESQSGEEIYYTKTVNGGADPGYFRLGANILAGLDFYLTKKLYVGTELSFGVNYTNYLSTKTTSNSPAFSEPEPFKRGNAIGMGLNANSQIRLGFAF